MSRKTVSVEMIKNQVNEMLLHGMDDDQRTREALIALIEPILMDSGNYSGFRFLGKTDMEKSKNGTTVGINQTAWDSTYDKDSKAQFNNTDHTRVKYF